MVDYSLSVILKGSGTIFKKRETLNIHTDFSTIDSERLFNLIERYVKLSNNALVVKYKQSVSLSVINRIPWINE